MSAAEIMANVIVGVCALSAIQFIGIYAVVKLTITGRSFIQRKQIEDDADRKVVGIHQR